MFGICMNELAHGYNQLLTDNTKWSPSKSEPSEGTLVPGPTAGPPESHHKFTGKAYDNDYFHVKQSHVRLFLVRLYC
jgi:hypothetical protein